VAVQQLRKELAAQQIQPGQVLGAVQDLRPALCADLVEEGNEGLPAPPGFQLPESCSWLSGEASMVS